MRLDAAGQTMTLRRQSTSSSVGLLAPFHITTDALYDPDIPLESASPSTQVKLYDRRVHACREVSIGCILIVLEGDKTFRKAHGVTHRLDFDDEVKKSLRMELENNVARVQAFVLQQLQPNPHQLSTRANLPYSAFTCIVTSENVVPQP